MIRNIKKYKSNQIDFNSEIITGVNNNNYFHLDKFPNATSIVFVSKINNDLDVLSDKITGVNLTKGASRKIKFPKNTEILYTSDNYFSKYKTNIPTEIPNLKKLAVDDTIENILPLSDSIFALCVECKSDFNSSVVPHVTDLNLFFDKSKIKVVLHNGLKRLILYDFRFYKQKINLPESLTHLEINSEIPNLNVFINIPSGLTSLTMISMADIDKCFMSDLKEEVLHLLYNSIETLHIEHNHFLIFLAHGNEIFKNFNGDFRNFKKLKSLRVFYRTSNNLLLPDTLEKLYMQKNANNVIEIIPQNCKIIYY